jgi:hypothetical protein
LSEPEDESAATYLATTAFLNIVGVVFVPCGLFFSHASSLARQEAFLAFTAVSIGCFFVLARTFITERRYRFAVFTGASFVSMLIVSWLWMWPDLPRIWVGQPLFHLVEAVWNFDMQSHNRRLNRLIGDLFMIGALIAYVLLFFPIMLAWAASRQWTQNASAFDAQVKAVGDNLGKLRTRR